MSISINHSNRFLVIFIFLAFAAGLFYLSSYNLQASNIFFANDQSTDFIIAKLADSGSWPLLGPPSHTGGRHLGPLYYWFVIIGAKFSGFDIYGATLFYALGKILAASFLTIFLFKILPAKLRYISLLGMLFVFTSIPAVSIFRTQWHSNYLIIPSTLAVLSGALVVLKSVKFLPLFIISQALLLLSHLSAVPVVAGLSIFMLVFVLWPTQRRQFVAVTKSLYFWLAIVAAFVLFSFPLSYEYYYPSNIKKLFFTHTDSAIVKAGFIEALNVSKDFLLTYTISEHGRLREGWLVITLTSLFILMLGHFFLSSTNKLKCLLLMLLAPILVTFLMLTVFKSPLHKHYYNSSIAIPFLLFGLSFGHALFLLIDKSKHKFSRGVASLFVALILLLLPLRMQATYKSLKLPIAVPSHTLEHVKSMAEFIKKDAGQERALVFARLSAKLAHNGYYYFLRDLQPEAEYRGFFPEISEYPADKKLPDVQLGYIVTCPKPYSFTEADILAPFLKDWVVDARLSTAHHTSISSCSVLRLKRTKRV